MNFYRAKQVIREKMESEQRMRGPQAREACARGRAPPGLLPARALPGLLIIFLIF